MANIRIGLGTDTHRLVDSLPLIIGGISIPHTKGCVAHSDGDALIHAICDALLGAANLRDIGFHFPDTSEENKNKPSSFFLKSVIEMLTKQSFSVGNIDCTIKLQKPKLQTFIPDMKSFLAEVMLIDESQISIKAKTGDLIGIVGREEAIEVECVALIEKI
jgi:2-C-methyl-D-erythritol 2,4-cyclodiphosphate synthase